MFTESAQSLEQLPVVFETTDDNNISNLTRTDINCDKTGTCYDGKIRIIINIITHNNTIAR